MTEEVDRSTNLTATPDQVTPAPTFEECEVAGLEAVSTDELQDNGSIRAYETDSVTFLIDGLKMASEGCLHAEAWLKPSPFAMLAVTIDKIRRHCAEKAGVTTPQNMALTEPPAPGKAQTRMWAYLRISDGLLKASTACRQMGSYHQGDEEFVKIGWGLYEMRQNVTRLIQLRAQGNGLVISSH